MEVGGIFNFIICTYEYQSYQSHFNFTHTIPTLLILCSWWPICPVPNLLTDGISNARLNTLCTEAKLVLFSIKAAKRLQIQSEAFFLLLLLADTYHVAW